MKFLVDAQLPRRLALQLNALGHDAVHTLDLPAGNQTSDSDILVCARQSDRVVITKDSDFVTSFLLSGEPKQLLLVSTGNLPNTELEAMFASNHEALVNALAENAFVELNRTSLVVHA